MCLAVPGKVVEVGEESATVDLQGNRLSVNTVLTPGVRSGQWVLVHAGFAITTIRERDALETWDYLRATDEARLLDEAGLERAEPEGGR
jgi:hydrogenase expression/formation protein HypC